MTSNIDQSGLSKKSKKYETTHPVFRIKPDNYLNTATVKYVGFINDGEKLGDEIIDLDGEYRHHDTLGKNVIELPKYNEFTVRARIYRCNVVGSHIVVSSRYPVMYLDVGYDRPLVTGSLFQIFISIDMNKDEKKSVKDTKNYVNLKFSGTWKRHLDCDDEMRENYLSILSDMLENEGATKFYKSTDEEIVKLRETYTPIQVAEWIQNYVEKEREFYTSLMNEQDITFSSVTKMRDTLVELCTSDRFAKFVEIGMRCREIHRRKEYGLKEDDMTYTVPKDVIKLDDVKNQMIENGEINFDD